MFEGYSDALVIRHEYEGVSKFISDIVDVPVINAGDGAGQHPTQTLLDLFTIKKEIGEIDNLKIALIGDLKFGRTVHSLANALGLFKNMKIYLVSPPELKMPNEILHDLNKTNIEYEEVESIEKIIEIRSVSATIFCSSWVWARCVLFCRLSQAIFLPNISAPVFVQTMKPMRGR